MLSTKAKVTGLVGTLGELGEMLMSAQINFDNLTKLNPVVADHPMYKIARGQLDEAVKRLTDTDLD